MKKSSIYWIVGGLGTAVAVYFIYKKINEPTISFGETPNKKMAEVKPKINTSTSASGLPLKRNSRGDMVKQLQRFLVAEGYDIGIFGANKDGVDGVFGMMTEKAVRENQQPFATFKSMYPSAVEGQVSADFFNSNIKGQY